MSKTKFAVLIGIVVIGAMLGIYVFSGSNESKDAGIEIETQQSDSGAVSNEPYALKQRIDVSSGWTITSYQDVNEAVYDGAKVQVFDVHGVSLGFYKSDFLDQVKIDGSGKGDGIQNSGKYLHYDYNIDDGKAYYLVDKSLGAYGNELVPWTGERPSVAVNPPLPYGTIIRFENLGPDAVENPGWVNLLLTSKTFYADDRFFGEGNEKRIDVYVGLQKTKNMGGTPESLSMHDVTIYIKRQ